MRTVKRMLAILMAMALLACVPVAVSAEEASAQEELFGASVLHSVTTEEDTGLGLAFLFKMNVRGVAVNADHEFVNTNAVATVDGVDYQVVSMGAVVTNQPVYMDNMDTLTLDAVNEDGSVVDIPVKYLYYYLPESCTFAVRIIRLPAQALGLAVAARPYCVLKDAEGNETTLYGDGDVSTYNAVYYTNASKETPTLTPAIGNVDDRLAASATAEYAAIADNHREGFKVSVTLNNVSSKAITTEGDTITYVCKDAEGNTLATKTVSVGVMVPGDTKTVEFYAPIATATIEQAAANLHYVPVITLPAIGTDIDVTKKKDRIRVSAASASFNADGTIQVSLTFRNYTTNWITEEVDYVQYTCYNAAGTVVQKATNLYIGCIDTKKNVSKTFTFTVPANTATVKLTKSSITYWTEWA